MSDYFIDYRVLDSLSVDFKQLKVSCTALREKWRIDELISVCVQEKDSLILKKSEKDHLTLIAPSKKATITVKRLDFR